jgi:hypothetical protein
MINFKEITMRLEKLEKKLLIWETGRQKNQIEYDSTENLDKYERLDLSNYEEFFRKHNETDEADKIKKHLGKMLKYQSIPKLIPTGNYKINSFLYMLKDSIDRYVEEYNLNLDPDFQRHHVWNLNQRIQFVEFILQGGKCNPIYFNHTAWMKSVDGEMVVVDGKQRLTSLLMFLNNEFTVFKNLDDKGIGFYSNEFNHVPYNIEIVINSLPTKKQVLEWYLQINKGNVAHTKEELDKVENMLKEIN